MQFDAFRCGSNYIFSKFEREEYVLTIFSRKLIYLFKIITAHGTILVNVYSSYNYMQRNDTRMLCNTLCSVEMFVELVMKFQDKFGVTL